MHTKNAFEIKYRIKLRDLRFLKNLPWGKGKHETATMFSQWDSRPGMDDNGLVFFGEWFGRPAYASTWNDTRGGMSHLSITWIEQVLSAEIIERWKKEPINTSTPMYLLDFFLSPRQGLAMLFSETGKMLVEESFFAPSPPITCEMASCVDEMGSKQKVIKVLNRSVFLKKGGIFM